ncbi:MAG TPA: hypothetical protein ENG42_01395, partial [Candidatus Aenigmarchaeota archaeon]|nr:hypothetical protein [Candidatus Aenigmarchaeota archaeon]
MERLMKEEVEEYSKAWDTITNEAKLGESDTVGIPSELEEDIKKTAESYVAYFRSHFESLRNYLMRAKDKDEARGAYERYIETLPITDDKKRSAMENIDRRLDEFFEEMLGIERPPPPRYPAILKYKKTRRWIEFKRAQDRIRELEEKLETTESEHERELIKKEIERLKKLGKERLEEIEEKIKEKKGELESVEGKARKALIKEIRKLEKSKEEILAPKKPIPLAFKDLFEERGPHLTKPVFQLSLILIGIITSSFLKNSYLLWAFIFLSLYYIIPSPKNVKVVAELGILRNLFSLAYIDPKAKRAWYNTRYANSGVAGLKSLFKLLAIIFFSLAFYTSRIPFSALVFLVFIFIAYFSMPRDYDPKNPQEFFESLFRFLFAIWVSIFVFGLLGTTKTAIFYSPSLAMIYLLFFAVIPVPKKESEEGKAVANTETIQWYTSIDKMVFISMMIILAISILSGWGLEGSLRYMFWIVWIVSLITGLLSSPETRPYTGVIMFIFTFFIFSIGPGQSVIGQAFFGQWWPTVHNTLVEVFKPMGMIFSKLTNTFSNTYLLLTNPVEYAQKIMEGSYVRNEFGVTGAYGLEIESFSVDKIYADEPFTIRFNLANKGSYVARDVKVEIWSNIPGFSITNETHRLVEITELRKELRRRKYNEVWHGWGFVDNSGKEIPMLSKVDVMDVVPLFFITSMSCEDVKKRINVDYGTGILNPMPNKENAALKYITFESRIIYTYEVDSTLQIKFISDEEWKRRVRENKLIRAKVASKIKPAPVKLNLDTIEQPIKEGTQFYVGFNLESSQTNGKIGWAKLRVKVPKEFSIVSCTVQPLVKKTEDGSILLWKFNKENKKEAKKEAFCLFRGLTKDDLAGSPEKIFTIFANATYEFERWEEKNTLTSFSDICKEKERAFEVLKEELKDFCRKRINKGQGKCNLGMGECRGDDECCFNDEDCPGDHANGFRYTYDANGDGKETWLKCRK